MNSLPEKLILKLEQNGFYGLHTLSDIETNIDSFGRSIIIQLSIQCKPDLLAGVLPFYSAINKSDKNGETALHHAARNKCISALSLLVEAGADLNATDKFGNSPLWRAVFESKNDNIAVEFLLKNGADPDLKNTSGISPMTLANTISNYDAREPFRRIGKSID